MEKEVLVGILRNLAIVAGLLLIAWLIMEGCTNVFSWQVCKELVI